MKIVMIHGQNHKGSTYHIGRILAEKLASEQEIAEFFYREISIIIASAVLLVLKGKKKS